MPFVALAKKGSPHSLGCIRRFFAWLCRSGTIPANPAADLDLPRKQSRRLPKALDENEIQRLLAIPNPADPFGLRDHSSLPCRKLRMASRRELLISAAI